MGGSQCKCKNCKNEPNDVFLNDVIYNEGYEELNVEEENNNEHKEEVQEKECKTNALTKNNTTEQIEGNKNSNNENVTPQVIEGEINNKQSEEEKKEEDKKEQSEKCINNNPKEENNIKNEEVKEQKEDEITQAKEITQENNNTQCNTKPVKKVNNKRAKSRPKTRDNNNPKHLLNNNISLSTLLTEKKINSLDDNEILFSSNLQKMLNNFDKKSVNYSDRFCIITKQHFSYYSTKESFMTMKKPLCKLPLKYITRIEQELIDNSTLYFCIVFQLNEETNSLMKQINSFSVINNEEGSNNVEEGMLGFRSDSNEIILKWVGVLNYFVNKNQSEQ